MAEEEVLKVLIMSYFEFNNPDQIETELIDVSTLREEIILKFLNKIQSEKPKKILGQMFLKSPDENLVAKEIIKLFKEDLKSTQEEFDFNGFSIQYFFIKYNPVVQMSSFSCEIKNLNGGAIIYDIIRVFRYGNEYYLLRE